jgi:hypothetical protein
MLTVPWSLWVLADIGRRKIFVYFLRTWTLEGKRMIALAYGFGGYRSRAGANSASLCVTCPPACLLRGVAVLRFSTDAFVGP